MSGVWIGTVHIHQKIKVIQLVRYRANIVLCAVADGMISLDVAAHLTADGVVPIFATTMLDYALFAQRCRTDES